MTLYRGFHIVLQGGRYTVFAQRDERYGYVGRKGEFNDRAAAERWVRELKAKGNSPSGSPRDR